MKLSRHVGLAARITVGALVALAVATLAVTGIWHLKILQVQTGSMQPTFASGDALFMQSITMQKLKPGMVVTYHSSRNPKELVTHRVIQVGPTGFQTQGDALSSADPPVRSTAVVGRVVVVAPGLGRVIGWLQTWPGLVCAVYIPAMSMMIYGLHYLEWSVRELRLYRDTSRQVV